LRGRGTRGRSDETARPLSLSQLGFFGDGQRTLVDDETGRMLYVPGFVDAASAETWFTELRTAAGWKSERRWMYDREVEVPRLVASYRLSDPALPDVLGDAARRAADFTGEPFNSIGLNRYRDGRDSVAPHNDHLYEIVKGHPIGLISLGATRLMTIRSKAKPRRVFDLDLENGSLLLMSYETQVNYDHGVPKTRADVGERISIALRVRPAAQDDRR
jgi:alkylated DNA repair dioxygenase AlkB